MTVDDGSRLLGRRYRLTGKLGEGGMGVVYRAVDRLNGQTVALKCVHVPPEDLVFASKANGKTNLRVALSGEFQTLASLHHPNIISVLDYGFDERRRPYFTMEFVDEAQTIVEAGHDRPVDEKIDLLIQMLQAMIYLHRRGILHRDLKPGNVLVQDGQVKVVDFGLCVSTNSDSMRHMTQTTAGTFAYMAPELFQGAPVSRASDLYAVGVIAYELFAGHHPFNINNMAMLVNEILNKVVSFDAVGIHGNLADVMERLLVKDDSQRYQDAKSVMVDLCAAVGQPLPPESAAQREGFLQAAKFVGREDQVAHLTRCLKETMEGFGSVWLIGGESGVGKSRLVDELRTLALVRGVLVLRGQAVSEGGALYQVWREILRWLCLITEMNDDEAAVLKQLVPDIEALVGRTVPMAPVLDPQATQNRLLVILTDVFRRQQHPLLLILEDLQWVGSESLTILDRLKTVVPQLPVFIVGNYRDDERPDLPADLPGVQILKLERLDTDDIEELSGSILGERGRQPEFVALLERETEGNSFFLVEVMRELAAEAGQLDRIVHMTLPHRILAGGVQKMIQRRLDRVPPEHRSLLQLAAVIGRQINLDVLRSFAYEQDLDNWMAACVNAAVFDIQNEKWRFAHDKLREAILDELDDENRPELHRQVAEAIEKVYPENVEYAAALGYHFQQAGDREKAVHYLAQAADHARKSFSNTEAIQSYRTAIELVQQLQQESDDVGARRAVPLQDNTDSVTWNDVLIRLYDGLGDVLELIGQHEDARQSYDLAIASIPEDGIVQRAQLYRKVGKTWNPQREWERALEAMDFAQDQLGNPSPDRSAEWRNEWIENQLEHFFSYYWLGRIQDARALVQHLQPYVEQYGTVTQKGLLFGNLAANETRASRYTPSDQIVSYSRMGFDAIRETDNLGLQAYYQFLHGFILLWHGSLDDAERELLGSMNLCAQIGDVTNLPRCVNYLTMVYRKRGDIEKVREYTARTIEVSHAGNMIEYVAAAEANAAWIALREGRIAEAHQLAIHALELYKPTVQHLMFAWIVVWPLVGALYQSGELAEAIEQVRVMLNPAQQPQPEALTAAMLAAVQAWESGDTDQTRQHLTQASEIARQYGYL